jgi:hypothetical protein
MDKLQQHTSKMLADMAVQNRRSRFVKAEQARVDAELAATPLRVLALRSVSLRALIVGSETVQRGGDRA